MKTELSTERLHLLLLLVLHVMNALAFHSRSFQPISSISLTF
jgi:hypothetical protein